MKRLVATVFVMMFVAVAALSVSAPGQAAPGQKVVSRIAVKVNKDIILESEVRKFEDGARAEVTEQSRVKGDQLQKAIDERLKDSVRDLIDKYLILQEANNQGLDANLEVIKEIEKLRVDNHFASEEALEAEMAKQGASLDDFKENIRFKNLRAQLFRHEVTGKIVITTEEMRTYYEAHKEDFNRPPGISIGIIVVGTDGLSPEEVEAKKKIMAEALAGLKRGEEFEDMARKYSEDPSGQDGGALPFFERKADGTYDLGSPEMEEIVSKLAKGKYTDVITNPQNHTLFIVQLQDRHDGGILPFETAQTDIYSQLMNERAEPKVRAYLTKLRAEGYVEVSPGFMDTGAATKPVRASDSSFPK